MAYKIIVQDGIVTYSSANPTTSPLDVVVNGAMHVSDNVSLGTEPTSPSDATTKNYVDTAIAAAIADSGVTSITAGVGSGLAVSPTTGNVVITAPGPVASASSVPWSGVTSKPTTIAGYGITDAYTKTQVNFYDYLNFPPFAGVLKENQVPVSSTFGMSQTAWGSTSFSFTDNTGKTVIFFQTSTPIGDNHMYRAYRFSDADPFVYDSNPLEVTFLNPGEKVFSIANMGTNFAIIRLSSITVPETLTRTVAVWTNGSSSWQDWLFAYDVSSLMNPSGARTNLYLLSTTSGDRILQYWLPTNQFTAELRVYDSTLTLLRSQEIYNYSTDVTNVDQTAAGRHSVSQLTLLNYAAYGLANPFTWNPFTETFNSINNSYYTYKTAANANIGQGISVSLSWSIPLTWIESGTGTPANLIPVKASGYRYNQLPDTTWDTNDGGCAQGWGGSGICTSIVTDDYTGDTNVLSKSSFQNTDVATYRRLAYDNGYVYKTFGSNNNSKLLISTVYNSPDGSPWSKTLRPYWLSIIDNNVRMQAQSTRYGIANVQTTMSTTSFSSVTRADDTIILDSGTVILDPEDTDPPSVQANYFAGAFGVVVELGLPTYYHTAPGAPVYTITSTGINRVYTNTGLVMPALPATIGSVTVSSWQQVVAWNGSTIAPIYWALIKDPTSLVYMAKNVGGVWSIPGAALLRTEQIAGNTNRGDTTNSISIITVSGPTLLTELGRILFNFTVPYTGNTAYYWGCYYVDTDTEETGTYTRFAQITTAPPSYATAATSAGFGYNVNLGYYRATAPTTSEDLCLICSKDMAGAGVDLTENQWFNNTATRYELFITTESATGLVAYTSSYPIFLGGYYSTVPAQAVTLTANSNNYIYAARDPIDRNIINISVSTTQLASSNTRALLANVVTDAENVVSQTSYNVAQHDTVEELENVTITTKQPGDTLTWDGDSWIAQSYSLVPTGTVAYFMGTVPPSGWLIANGATISPSTYPALTAVLGGNVLPDLRGVFIRGLDLGAGLDPGRTLNTYQADEFASHNHGVLADNGGFNTNPNNVVSGTDRAAVYTALTTSTGGTETRPKNVSMLPIIKY